MKKFIAYYRVLTAKQGESGLGLHPHHKKRIGAKDTKRIC
jgi:hypothetical protein